MDQDKDGKRRSKLSLKKRKKHQLHKDDITVVDTDVAKKAVVATAMGNAMEWFDFGIYSYLAATIGKVFFPEMAGPTQLVFSFATFAVAFLVRPIGGMFFGMLGDRLGRKKILAITLIIMALATLSIGLIPGYATIGITAPILLLIARLVQGFSTGGEYSGAMTFIAESAPDKRRGVMASGLEVGTLVGYIGGSGIVTLLTFILGSETMLDWGWRIPFLIAAPIGFIGLYLRTHLEETPAFEKMEEEKEKAEKTGESKHVSMKDILIHHRRPLLIGLTLVFFYNVIDYTVLTYMPSHLTAVLGYGETKGLLLILIVMFIMIPFVLLMGHFGDRIGNKRIIQSSLIGIIVLAIPSFMLINSGNNWLVFAGLLILATLLAALLGTMPSQLPSLFFTNVRYGGLAITYNISTSLFGGTAPLLVAWLVDVTASQLAPAYYVIFASIIGIVVVTLFLKNTSGKPLRGSPPAVQEKEEIEEILENTDDALWWREEKKKIDRHINDAENKND
ncbi:MFS transporter [Lentibacillus populi]|uniref:Putative proline/betaine transporter n=1 Tax=Lentibacillus populi TaxID=1827502 RepID=A0A9W5TYY9_9BACI|nr:glycine betaine/L-proline transporter ProP [Lentibacillus populi]MBT2215611.1 glycine betaine/L-proline transporter ProP [Virgibacillus dakarensis]GGB48509.1 MFS transporter [Lentibacillus populi]